LKDLRNFEYDKLNVVFFGETNAGKSTLIEALIRGDGRSIGDGRKDFTKNYKILSFSKDINLIDTPGIEGNEGKVINSIRKAVNKAHVVFYVFSSNKEPEEGTLKKIKSFLNEHAYIYGVMNIRILAKNEEDLYNKISSSSLKVVEDRTKEKLMNIFGNRFKGLIKVHALYAFYARAKKFKPLSKEVAIFVSQSKAKQEQEKFGGKDKLEKASNINSLIDEINKLKKQYRLSILWSNTRKVLNRQGNIISRILKNKKGMDNYIKGLEEALKKLDEKYEKDKEILKFNINGLIRKHIADLEKELRDKSYSLIDENVQDKEVWNKAINKIATERGEQIEKDIKAEIDSFESKIKKELDFLKGKIEGLSKYITKYRSIDFDKIIDSLKIHISDIVKEIGDVILKAIAIVLAALSGPLGIIGAIVLGFLSFIGKIFDWLFMGEDKKAKAKRKANEEIKKAINNVENNLKEYINQTIPEIERKMIEIKHIIRREQDAVKQIKKDIKAEIDSFESKIKKELDFLKEKIEWLSKYITKYMSIDFDKIIDSLKIHISDIVKEIGDVILKAIPVVLAALSGPWGIIVAIVGAFLSFIGKIFGWLFMEEDKKAKAKRKADEEIKKVIKNIESELEKNINQTISEIERKMREIKHIIRRGQDTVKYISFSLNEVVNKLISIHYEISEAFLKTLDSNVEFGYIKTTIREGNSVCVVCSSESLIEKLRTCGIENIFLYINKEDMLSDIKEREGEFFKRLREFLEIKKIL